MGLQFDVTGRATRCLKYFQLSEGTSHGLDLQILDEAMAQQKLISSTSAYLWSAL